jgi:hypothetical protein
MSFIYVTHAERRVSLVPALTICNFRFAPRDALDLQIGHFFQKRGAKRIYCQFHLFWKSAHSTMATTANYAFPDLLEDRAHPVTKAARSRPPLVIDLMATTPTTTQSRVKNERNGGAPDEDVSLSELLDDDFSDVASREVRVDFKANGAHSDGTSETTTSDANTHVYSDVGMEEFSKYENTDDEDCQDSTSEDSSGSSDSSYESEKTSNLLEKAHDRLALQNLKEDIKELEATVDRKNEETEQLSGQLRRAVATKCDLVISHSELERHHELNMKQRDSDMVLMQQANYALLEIRAKIEKEFMNELSKVTEDMKEEKAKHREEMDDWERMHRNEMLEKEFQIAKLSEEIRKATGHAPRSDKKKGFAGIFKHSP